MKCAHVNARCDACGEILDLTRADVTALREALARHLRRADWSHVCGPQCADDILADTAP